MIEPTPMPQMMDGATQAPRDEGCIRTIGAPKPSTPPPSHPAQRPGGSGGVVYEHRGFRKVGDRCRYLNGRAIRVARSDLLDPTGRLVGGALGLQGRRIDQVAHALLDLPLGLLEGTLGLALGLAHVLLGRAFGLQRVVAGDLPETFLQTAHHFVLRAAHVLLLCSAGRATTPIGAAVAPVIRFGVDAASTDEKARCVPRPCAHWCPARGRIR